MASLEQIKSKTGVEKLFVLGIFIASCYGIGSLDSKTKYFLIHEIPWKKYVFFLHCCGNLWFNLSEVPITRIYLKVSRKD